MYGIWSVPSLLLLMILSPALSRAPNCSVLFCSKVWPEFPTSAPLLTGWSPHSCIVLSELAKSSKPRCL